jgi:hypothetical protein
MPTSGSVKGLLWPGGERGYHEVFRRSPRHEHHQTRAKRVYTSPPIGPADPGRGHRHHAATGGKIATVPFSTVVSWSEVSVTITSYT